MRLRRFAATSVATVIGSALMTMSPAHADPPVTVTVAGIITVTSAPAGAVLVPPASLPGNATGTDSMVVTSNTGYHVTVHADNAKMRPWSGTAYTAGNLGSGLSLAPGVLVAGPTLTIITLTTSDQKIVSSNGGTADTYTLDFTQPIAASDPLGLYRAVVTYTVSSGL